jgi:hypothetical protein
MHSKPNPNDPEARELLARIRRDFGEILRGHGVSLHETWVIDRYGSMRERKKARKLDTDQHWWEVRDEWIEEFGGVGGLSFLDDKGFTYYLPAYMSYWLRTGQEPNCLSFYIAGRRKHRYKLFTAAQRETIAAFVSFVNRLSEGELER